MVIRRGANPDTLLVVAMALVAIPLIAKVNIRAVERRAGRISDDARRPQGQGARISLVPARGGVAGILGLQRLAVV
jgi:hypothetical protein